MAPPLLDCRAGDAQCDATNAELKKRRVIFVNEHIFNSVAAHYWAGFITITFVLRAHWSRLPRGAASALAGAITGWFLADVISYIVHMFIDSQLYDRHVHGKAQDNKAYTVVDEHHKYTLNYSYMNGLELTACTYPFVLPILTACSALHFLLFPRLLRSPMYVAFYASLTTFAIIGASAHKWAHERNHHLYVHPIVRFLQDCGVLLGPNAHSGHHTVTDAWKGRQYSLSTGASQAVLDPILTYCRDHTTLCTEFYTPLAADTCGN